MSDREKTPEQKRVEALEYSRKLAESEGYSLDQAQVFTLLPHVSTVYFPESLIQKIREYGGGGDAMFQAIADWVKENVNANNE